MLRGERWFKCVNADAPSRSEGKGRHASASNVRRARQRNLKSDFYNKIGHERSCAGQLRTAPDQPFEPFPNAIGASRVRWLGSGEIDFEGFSFLGRQIIDRT